MIDSNFSSEVEQFFGRLRKNPFNGHQDPNQIIQEQEMGSSNVGPGGWTNKADFSTAIGQQNLLDDPILESVVTHTVTTTERRFAQDWYAKYILNSGSAPTTIQLTKVARTDKTNNTMNSDVMALQIAGPAGASNATVHIYTKDKISIASTRPNLDWLIDALRVFRFTTPFTTTNLTTLNVTLELVKNLTGTPVIADADVLACLDLTAGDVRLLYCGAEQPFTNGDEYDVRIKVDYVSTGSASTDIRLGFFLPQLHYNYGREPAQIEPERFGAYPFGGDGEDGNVTIASGTTTLTRDMYYNRLTVAAGARIVPAGYRIFCKDFLLNNGTISMDGNVGSNGGNATSGAAGAGGAGGAALTATTAPLQAVGGSAGLEGNSAGAADPGVAAAAGASPSIGPAAKGGGGGGAVGTSNGAAGADSVAPTEPHGFRSPTVQTSWQALVSGAVARISGTHAAGGGGGGGGGVDRGGGGGGAGGAGGIVWASAATVAGFGTFSATGGDGGDGGNGDSGDSGGGGGGSGGSGGWVILLSRYNLFNGTYTVTGGDAGVGGAGDGDGSDGDAGSDGLDGSVLLLPLDPRQ